MEAQVAREPYHKIGRWKRGHVRAVELTARDLDYLFALLTFGALSTSMLQALVVPGHSQRTVTDRLFLLKHPPNDYVVQPAAQERSRAANHTSLAFEISDKGALALVDADRISYDTYVLWKKVQANYKPQHFDHDLATGAIQASMQLGARAAELRFIPCLEILTRSKCPAETRASQNPIALPYEISGERHTLVPDALFGIEYRNGACFFALETDMGSEQIKDSEFKHATIAKKLRGYRAILRDEMFRKRWALPSLYVLTVTRSVARMHNMIEHLARVAQHDPNTPAHALLFQAAPRLTTRKQNSILQCDTIFTSAWQRANHPQLSIATL